MIKNYIKKFERCSILISCLMLILSLFLIFRPVKSVEAFMIIFSIIVFISGLFNLYNYFTVDREERLYSFDLLLGVINLIASVLIFIYL